MTQEERRVSIPCGDLSLEGALGGNMDNNVVWAVTQAYASRGYTTLRFNFRGVGGSEGSYGEGTGESRDVAAALDLLRQRGTSSPDLAGYSFGAWVIARALPEVGEVGQVLMVSPPVAFMGFSFLGRNPRIRWIITGERDPFAPPDEVRSMARLWNPDCLVEVVDGADHFYGGLEGKLISLIQHFLDQGAGDTSSPSSQRAR